MSRLGAIPQPLAATLAVAALLALASPLMARPAAAQSEQQALVDRATLTVQEIVGPADAKDQKSQLRQARAVMVCPRVFKIGFFIGGEGGGCVLVARDGGGSWSYPAFYGMTTGSFGLQIGIQDSEFVMMILTEKGLHAVLDSQFKLGGDVSIALADLGAGVEGATTAAVGADIVAFSKTRGLFAGASLEGSLMSARSDWNKIYYGQELGARSIVIGMQGINHGADPLRQVLTRTAGAAPPPPAGTAEQPGGMIAPGAPEPVQRQDLAQPPSAGAAQSPATGAPQSLQLPKRQ